MQDNLKDILSHLSTEIDQETLLRYLQGKLSGDKLHEVEKILLENDFASEALEGLQQFRDKQQLNYTVEKLNRDLKKKLELKKKRRRKPELTDQSWLYITILILILLIVISYIVVNKMMH
ncbi:MAG: hypothetical protein LC128_07715 [Chitinophagales bacterium]|nr:hypothetical protein [Chitinophagales bacterium]